LKINNVNRTRTASPLTLLLRIAGLSLLAFVLLACNKKTGTSVTENLELALKSKPVEIDMRRAATDFKWDTMYVFSPYTPHEEICKAVKLAEAPCSKAGVRDVEEGEFALVFLQDGTLVRMESFPRKLGNFDESERCAGRQIGRGDARFRITQREGLPFLTCH
jgi:hypothetical protein